MRVIPSRARDLAIEAVGTLAQMKISLSLCGPFTSFRMTALLHLRLLLRQAVKRA
jgi:hypothetical protein